MRPDANDASMLRVVAIIACPHSHRTFRGAGTSAAR